MDKPTLSEYQAKLLDLLEEQLCLWDKKLYDDIEFDAELYFRKVHRAVDAVYRELEGIPQPTKTGRPLGHFSLSKKQPDQSEMFRLASENERLKRTICQMEKTSRTSRFKKKQVNRYVQITIFDLMRG